MNQLTAAATAIGAVALLLAACETPPSTVGPTSPVAGAAPACAYTDGAAALDAVQTRLNTTMSRDAYYETLRASYADLGAIAAQAETLPAGMADADRLACLSLAAEAAMIQSYLPLAQRDGLTSPGAPQPSLTALQAARRAIGLCGSITDPRRCAQARVLESAALAQSASIELRAAADTPGAPADTSGWLGLSGLIRAFGESAEDWSALLTSTAAAPQGADGRVRDLATEMLTPIACATYADGGALRRRPTATGTVAEEQAAGAYNTAYLNAMGDVATALGLAPQGAGAAACATAPEGQECSGARLGAVLSLCEDFWGLGGAAP